MTYSCSDFVDTILDALDIQLPTDALDDPSAQADLALAAIERLRNPGRRKPPREAKKRHDLAISVAFNKPCTQREATKAVNDCVHGKFYPYIREDGPDVFSILRIHRPQ